MPRTRDIVIALAGAAVVLGATLGLMEIDQRAGPYDASLQPAGLAVATSGTYATRDASGTSGPGGVCVPEPPATTCQTARTEITFSVTGLPPLPAEMDYAAQLSGDDTRPLGPLERDGTAHRLQWAVDEALPGPRGILVQLTPAGSAPGNEAPRVLQLAFDAPANEQTPLAAETTASVADTPGRVRVNEIGGFTISSTAVASLPEAPSVEDWAFHAWFEPRAAHLFWTYLGTFDGTHDGSVLDARVERVRVEDQATFVVYLAPSDLSGTTPFGFPAYAATIA